MGITEVRITLARKFEKPLLAFCRITIDNKIVAYNLKIIEGEKKRFITMPNRRLTSACQNCGRKNILQAHFCNYCGVKLDDRFHQRDCAEFRKDIFHPINADFRKEIEEAIFSAYREEKFSQNSSF